MLRRVKATRCCLPDLFDNELTGPIPPALGNLANLEWLTLSDNELTGPIPPALGKLASLETLGLSGNELTGPIPPELGNLAGLVRLYLDDNQLSGSVPDTLGNLTSLEHLFLRGNPLSGPLPQSLTQLSVIERLIIDRTGVCVPADAAFQAWLATIPDFTSSGLTCGAAVTVAFESPRYTVAEGESVPVTLHLSQPPARTVTIALTATPGGGATAADHAGVPSAVSFGPADVVRTFWFEARADRSSETGETVTLDIGLPLPEGVAAGTPTTATVTLVDDADGGAQDRTILEALYHATSGPNWTDDTNWLSDAPLQEWFGVVTNSGGRVTRLLLGHNNLMGALPRELGALGSLEWLHLGFNQLTGTIPPELGRLTNLENLDLSANDLTGAIPAELGRMANLESLNLSANDLTGTIPAELGRVANLESLSLEHNQLTGPIPPELGALASLRALELSNNQLTGPIPPELGALASLRELGLWGNRLAGAIPSELRRLISLEYLALGRNRLSGALPPELGDLVHLERLYLAYNRLTGAIPPELGRLANLRELDLSYNHVTDAIPPALGNLANLRELDLSYNHVTDAIPPALGNLANLESLQLAFNVELSGLLPLPLQSPLAEVDLHFTQVCAPPSDAAFEAWAATATFHGSGLTCGSPAPAVSAIDVAIFYTPAARRAAGGTAAIEAEIDLMVAETNQAYRDSGVHQRVVLAAREEVQYTEADSVHTDVRRLADPSDGHLDEVHTIRDRVGADLVHLVAGPGPICGVAADIASRADTAFGLTRRYCGGIVFAHEMGHNMGLQHDRHVACGYSCSNWPAPYSHGYVNQRSFATGAPQSLRWVTIMAYRDQCLAEGFDCETVLRFSNPTQTWNGDPLGVPGDLPSDRVDGPSDAVRLLNNSRHVMASFRDAPANRPPQPDGRLPDRMLEAGPVVVELAGAFWDPDGDVLTFGATSSEPSVVAVSVSGSMVTVTAVSAGTSTVTVTATDAGGSNTTATQAFTVAVPASNRPPEAVGALPDVRLRGLSATLDVDVSPAFDDPDGDALIYAVSSSAPHVVAARASGARVTLTAVSMGTATIEVTATDPDGLTAAQSFGVRVTVPFTDDPIRPGETPVRAIHFAELRTRIDILLGEAGLAPFGWTDPVLRAGVTPVKLTHLLDLRSALAAAYLAAGRSAPVWTDPAPVEGTTPIRAAHLMELRAAVMALE